MRKLFYFFPFLLLLLFLLTSDTPDRSAAPARKHSKAERIDGYLEHLRFTSMDVELGYIPYEKLIQAIREGNQRLEQPSGARTADGTLSASRWTERGPSNVGGRTRAIMIDGSDPSRNRIWIGSVSGGVWRTNDITKTDPAWEHLAPEMDNMAIGCIAQDPNQHQTIYVGTGEGFNNADAVNGAGIFKSTDDGITWTWLAGTQVSKFQNTRKLYVHTNGDVYAGTETGGLLRSSDGGNTWVKVLGTSLSGASSNNIYDLIYIEANQTFYASNENSVFKSSTGNRGDWLNIGNAKPGFPGNLVRVELAVCASDPSVMYVIGSIDGSASEPFVSFDGGESWFAQTTPGEFPGDDFTNGQAWYDLEIGVDPFDCAHVLAGGVPIYESFSSGSDWHPYGNGRIHVDQHNITFDPGKQNRVLFGNDGGIWLTDNGAQGIREKSLGYVTSQFYAAAIHPDAGSLYLLGGTQDNGSMKLQEPGISPAIKVQGGDGVFCFIDQNEPDIQIVSYQYGDYSLSLDGGNNFEGGIEIDGSFINRSGYDDSANILYGQTTGADFFRWNINTGVLDNVDINGVGIVVSAVRADPNTPNRIYMGGSQGKLARVDNAHESNTVQGEQIAQFSGNASVSSVYVDKLNADHLLVSLFNFGANLENIYISYDGGSQWTAIEGDLPDMPVRWAIFDPADHDRVMIATEAGVWITDHVDGALTHWEPVAPANGMPFVKVEMLLMRESDKVVLAATHGRGLFTTDIFSPPLPVILAKASGLENQLLTIDGSESVNAQSYLWDLGDKTTSTLPVVQHRYQKPGTYTVTLTINGTHPATHDITISPYLTFQEDQQGFELVSESDFIPGFNSPGGANEMVGAGVPGLPMVSPFTSNGMPGQEISLLFEDIRVVPNPFREQIQVHFNENMNQLVTVRLYDTQGKILREQKRLQSAGDLVLESLDYPPGFYLVTVESSDGKVRVFRMVATP